MDFSTYDFEVSLVEQKLLVVLIVLIFFLLFDNYYMMDNEIQGLVMLVDDTNVAYIHLNIEN